MSENFALHSGKNLKNSLRSYCWTGSKELHRNKGYGKQAMLYWEAEMCKAGHKSVMTSTMVEESTQHFYRKLGYKDCGCLVMDIEPFVQTMEMFMMKQL